MDKLKKYIDKEEQILPLKEYILMFNYAFLFCLTFCASNASRWCCLIVFSHTGLHE